ncbi:MAG: RNA degradosome polyphosphate kinase, partial [Planctomycetaceae bacterium]|nr:RNA degradosome polyphosphate kinase [Planctomycetaceae bacterium]
MTAQQQLFFNRELSWLEFNQRVLGEALDSNVPLLERVKFLAITSSNLDEFFMVRVGGLNILVAQNNHTSDVTGRSPAEQLKELSHRTHEMTNQQYACFNQMLEKGMLEIGIRRFSPLDLNEAQHQALSDRFDREIYPVISPLGVHSDGRMPLIGNQTIHLAIRIKDECTENPHRIVILPLGSPIPRFITLQSKDRHAYILSEDVVSLFCDRYFPNQEILECTPFRITRNADMRVEEEFSVDLMEDMSALLESRKDSDCVRLEVAANCSKQFLAELQELFAVPEDYTFSCDGPLDLKAWFQIAGLRGFEQHQSESWPPTNSPRIDLSENIFEEISKNDVILHHPFESFDPVIRLVEAAANDPDVLAIKQTLYRTSSDSPIVASLVRAAENGKSVTVIIELKARFDEARNIVEAKALQQAGAHVIY